MRGICSWSGGKDSALALQVAVEAGFLPLALLTILDESGTRSRSHGLPLAVLEAQAAAVGLPLLLRSASWDEYTEVFVDALAQLGGDGCQGCVFGDIDGEEHRGWCRMVCDRAGLTALHPLWRRHRRGLVEEFLGRGFAATVVVVRADALDRSFLGRRLDRALLDELDARGVDLCGENGEYHTVVLDGPLFAAPLNLRAESETLIGGCHGLRVTIDSVAARGQGFLVWQSAAKTPAPCHL